MNINKNIVNLMISSIFISQINLPLTSFAVEYINDDKTHELNNYSFDTNIYSDDVSKKLDKCLELLDMYMDTKDLLTLKECILTFSLIPSVMEYDEKDSFQEGDVFDYIYFSIRDEVYNLPENDEKNSMIIYLGENLFLGWRKFKFADTYGSKFLVSELVDYNKDKVSECQPRLEYLKSLYLYFLEEADVDEESNEIPDIDVTPPDFEPPIISPPDLGIEDDKPLDNNNNNNNNNNSPTIGEFTEYVKKNNKCFKVKTTYKNNVVISKTETPAPVSDYVRCKIYNGLHSISTDKFKPSIDRDYIDNDQNLTSKHSIYYTVNKMSKNPHYFNTGIKVSIDDKSASYNQLKDALYQVAIKSNGFSISDNDKALTVLEGKPFVLDKSKKETYSTNDIESLLNSTNNISLAVMESSEYKTYILEESLLDGSLDSIILNGETIQLSTPLILVDKQLFAPIQEIATLIGAETSLSENNLTIQKNSKKIEIKTNSKSYFVDKKEMLFTSEPIIKDFTYFSEIEPILSQLGYSINWDSDLGEIIIENSK